MPVPYPTFLFSHTVTSSKRVAQEKIITWNRFLRSKFSTENNDSKLHRLSSHHILYEFLKDIVEGILKNI